MVFTYLTTKYVFDLKPEDVFWCTADIGWVTGHSYIVYGPLAERRDVRHVRGRARLARPRALLADDRALRREHVLHRADGDSRVHEMGRRVAGEVRPRRRCACSARSASRSIPRRGCGITSTIGNKKCPIVDTWWQTETGGIMITPLPGATDDQAGECDAAVLRHRRGRAEREGPGSRTRAISPFASRGRACCAAIYGDPERYKQTYWSKWQGIYFPGDGAHQDKDGYFWIVGRVDDVVNVAGHRIGTAELESIFVEHPVSPSRP